MHDYKLFNNMLGRVIGKHGLSDLNNHGARFEDFFDFHCLVIGNKLFENRICHKFVSVSTKKL